MTGLVSARWRGQAYRTPDLRYLWLAFIAFLPQYLVVYLPFTRERTPDWIVSSCLLSSQVLLIAFAWLNRRLPGMAILIVGAALNLVVMSANGGFMPISPQTAGRLVSEEILSDFSPGDRFGTKDILLPPEQTRFEWLADRFLTPAWSPYQVAFSLGDVLIAVGVFRLLAAQRLSTNIITIKGVPI
jgi:hypothetical protein